MGDNFVPNGLSRGRGFRASAHCSESAGILRGRAPRQDRTPAVISSGCRLVGRKPSQATTTVAILDLSAVSPELPSARASMISVSMRSTGHKPTRLVRPILAWSARMNTRFCPRRHGAGAFAAKAATRMIPPQADPLASTGDVLIDSFQMIARFRPIALAT